MTIMIRMKSFNLFGVNLGPFSAHDCPDVHFRPAVVDWVMEGVALLLVVLGWVGVLWQYTTQGGQADGNMDRRMAICGYRPSCRRSCSH